VFCLALNSAVFAASSESFSINTDEVPYTAGDQISSTNYISARGGSIGGLAIGSSTSASYIMASGTYVSLAVGLIDFLALNLFDPNTASTSYTNSQTVLVSFEVSGSPYQMIISESADFTGASWVTYASSTNYTFSTTVNGPKVVFADLRDTGLTETGSQSASIILDTVAPTIIVSLEGWRAKTDDTISPTPDISGVLHDHYLDIASLIISIDNTAVTDGLSGGGRYDSWDATAGIVEYVPKTDLAEGAHDLRFTVEDFAGNTTSESLADLMVRAGDPAVLGRTLNFPNPFNPANGPTYIAYTLSVDSTVSIYLYDISLKPVWRQTYPAGGVGGRAGYNEVAWNGITSFSRMAENGIYFYRIVAEIGGARKVIGKGKIAVLR